ncbi:MAG TPA: hypothetical protein VGK20_05110 [Candidatus Binatia bacterium]|jgi:mRNA interferase MazF
MKEGDVVLTPLPQADGRPKNRPVVVLRTAPSLIRLGFLAVLPASSFLGSIGSISRDRHRRLLRRLAEHLLGAKP